MKVKTTLNISNKKKNALPSSKLLKPKTFKVSVKKSGEGNNQPLSKDKLKLLNENIDEIQSADHLVKIQRKPSKTIKSEINLSIESPNKSSHSISAKKVKNPKEHKTKKISTLFDFVASQKQTENQIGLGLESNDKSNPNDKHKIKKKKSEKNHTSKFVDKSQNKENETTIGLSQVRSSKISKAITSQKKNKKENATDRDNSYNIQGESKTTSKNKQSDKVDDDRCKKTDTAVFNKCNLKANKVAAVTKGLLKLVTANSSSKPDMLDVGEPILLQVECIKIPICPTKQLRFKLPHPVIDETSDVLLITADLKGHKIFPDKAVEHYEELLAKLDIDFINKVMPLRMIKKEYSQFEMRKKFVDQFDVILADSRIIKSLPPILGKFALYNRKMPIPVNLRLAERKLKNHLRDATHKTQMTVKSDGHCAVVQVGHTKMSAKDLAANVVEVAKSLESLYPGGWRNIRSLVVKTGTSTSLPVYLSLLSPNEVRIPVEVSRRPQPVEGELSTMPGYNVLVTPDGNVVLKKIDEERRIDDSRDDEILEEAEKYLESSKTVRYDESSDEEKEEKEDSDDEGETITDAMEKKLMNKYEKKAKAKKNRKEEEEEDEEEEEEEEEEESEIVPVVGKKRKSQDSKKKSGPPAKKAQGPIQPKGKKTADKASDAKKSASPGLKKPQTRGTRGGKKNKLSKDQRKALIKRKKAGKK